MSFWATLFKTALALALTIAKAVNNNQLLNAGESRQAAKDLASLQVRLGISDQVAKEVAALSDEELNSALRGDT